jgi:hypothetical protein
MVLRVLLAVLGGFAGLLVAFFLDIGAKPCQDVFVALAACAVPQPFNGGIALGVAVGVALPLVGFRFDDWRSRRYRRSSE